MKKTEDNSFVQFWQNLGSHLRVSSISVARFPKLGILADAIYAVCCHIERVNTAAIYYAVMTWNNLLSLQL